MEHDAYDKPKDARPRNQEQDTVSEQTRPGSYGQIRTIGLMRKQLEVEANHLSNRLSQINFCLQNLTHDMELSMEVWETLRRLGIR